MRRSRLFRILDAYAAGDGDAATRAEVERLAASDPRVASQLDRARGASDALRTLRERPDPPVRADDVLPRIQAAIASASFEPRPVLPLRSEGTRFYRRLAAAATLLFAVTAGLFAYNFAGGRAPAIAPRGTPHETPVLVDHRPTPDERGLEPFVDAGRRPDGIDADEFFRMLDRARRQPGELRVIPVDQALPPAPYVAEER